MTRHLPFITASPGRNWPHGPPATARPARLSPPAARTRPGSYCRYTKSARRFTAPAAANSLSRVDRQNGPWFEHDGPAMIIQGRHLLAVAGVHLHALERQFALPGQPPIRLA